LKLPFGGGQPVGGAAAVGARVLDADGDRSGRILGDAVGGAADDEPAELVWDEEHGVVVHGRVPHARNRRGLPGAFYAYVLAFYLLWIVWRQHHVLLDQVSRVSAPMIGWHFPLLLLAAFLPYATAVEGHYPANPAAALLFGLVVGGLLLCRTVIQAQASRGDVLLPDVDRRLYRATVAVSWIVVGYWAATLLLVWWAPWVQIRWFLTGPVAYLARRIATRRPVAPTRDKQTR
jgi:uncharacterized membrane protein